MKKFLFLPFLLLLAFTDATMSQGTNPLRINCPPNLTNWICGVASTASVAYRPPTTTAGCLTAAIVTCSPPSGALFPLGTTTVTCRATNSCRESAVCAFAVTVARDTVPPAIQCPTNRIVRLCGTAGGGAVVSWPPPVATDNADTSVAVTCSPPSGSSFTPGTTTVTCIATDNCTNRTTCTFTVTVARDTQPPTINCPPNTNVTACASTGAVVNYPTPTAVDNADFNVPVVCSPASGSVFPVGTTTVTCTATDDCANRTTCTFLVRVTSDITPPVITCPSNIVLNCLCPGQVIVLDFFQATATDNLDPNPTITCEPPSLVSSPGVHVVTCTATDRCGNSSRCSFTVTFNYDTEPPVITCPTNLTVWSSSNSAVVRYPVTASDNCTSNVTLVCTPPSGTVFPLGTSTVVCSATDRCTNRTTCTFTVTVRPPFFYNGLGHSTLGQAALNINGDHELEVSGLGTSGEDGVRINLGQSQGLRWQMKLPKPSDVDGRDFLIWQRGYGRTTAGTEIQVSEMLFTSSRGRLSLTPGATSYGLTLLRSGAVVYRDSGRAGAFNLPSCIPVWTDHCWEEGPQESPNNPLLPHCMWLLDLSCNIETPAGPILADAFIITPETPLPRFTALTAVEFVGRDVPILALRQERLMKFGDAHQSPVPHRALGDARLEARDGELTLANLGSSGQDGVRIELEESAGLKWRMRNPTGNPEGDVEFGVFGRTGNGEEIPLRRISHQYRSGQHIVTPGEEPYEVKLLRQGQVVFQQGGRTGAFEIPPCQPVEQEHCVGEPFEGWHPHVPYCMTYLTIECVWETPNGSVRADTLVLTPEDPVPPIASVSAVRILGRNIRGLDSLTLLSERVQRFGGTGAFRLTCPPDLTVQTCSTNSVPVRFPSPVVNGGTCSSAPFVTCVPPSGSLFPPGVTIVQCTATNACGERATCSFRVTVTRDTTPPVIQCPTNIIVGTCSPTGTVVNFPVPTATDNLDASPTVVCSPPSGSVFPPGTSVVTCTATDDCTNLSTCTFTVTVRPPLLYEGLCHSPLGAAVLNLNTNDELEISGFGTTGQDGVRIETLAGEGLHWEMRFDPGIPEGSSLIISTYSESPTGEVMSGRSTLSATGGDLLITPDVSPAGSSLYEMTFYREGKVVYQRAGFPNLHSIRVGGGAVPAGGPILEGCVHPAGSGSVIQTFGLWFTLEVDPREPGQPPVMADSIAIAPINPTRPLGGLGAMILAGTNPSASPLRLVIPREWLMLFGAPERMAQPHRAFSPDNAALFQRNSDRTWSMTHLDSTAPYGVQLDFEELGLRFGLPVVRGYQVSLQPLAFKVGDEFEFGVHARVGDPWPKLLGTLALTQISAAELQFRPECAIFWHLTRVAVYRAGTTVGGATLPVNVPVATLTAGNGAMMPRLIDVIKLPESPFAFALTFDAPGVFTLPDGTRLDGEEIRVFGDPSIPVTDEVSALDLTSRGLNSFTITAESPLERLLLACPSNRIIHGCSTTPVPVNFPPPVVTGGTCTLPATVVCVPPSGSLFPPGVTIVQCTATNACGERTTCSFRVTVTPDTTPPVIQCPTNIVIGTCSNFATVRFDVTATDNGDPNPTVVCMPPSGSLFPLATTTVTCTATDRCTNTSVCTFTVRVRSDATPELEIEPNDALASAHDLGRPQFAVVVGRIGVAGDTDYFRFTAPPDARAWITVDTGGQQWAGANSRNSAVALLNAGGAVMELDDNDGSGNGANSTLESGDASAIAGALLPGGTFFVRVSAAVAGDIIAPYRLYLNITTNNAGAEIEPNNTFMQANIVAGGAVPIGARLGTLAVNEEDWFSFSIPGPSIVHLSLDGDPERDGVGPDVVLELYRKDGVSLLFAANSSAGGATVAEGFPYRLSISGTYFVRVRGVSAGVTGTYRLMIATCPGRPELTLASGILRANGLRLSWPAASESSVLLATHDLRSWREIPVVPVFDGQNQIVDLSTELPHQFFQLAPAGGWSNDTYHCCDANGQNCSDPVNPLTVCDNLIYCYETDDSTVCVPH